MQEPPPRKLGVLERALVLAVAVDVVTTIVLAIRIWSWPRADRGGVEDYRAYMAACREAIGVPFVGVIVAAVGFFAFTSIRPKVRWIAVGAAALTFVLAWSQFWYHALGVGV